MSCSKGVLNEHKQRTKTTTAAKKKTKLTGNPWLPTKGHSLVYVVIYQDCQQTKWLPTVGDQL